MDSQTIAYLAINILISVALITLLRFLKGRLHGVSSTEELSVRDNFAFGLSYGGEIIGLSLVMMGVMSGNASSSLGSEIMSLLEYGILGLILIKAGGYFQDKVVLTKLPIQQEISQQNVAAAIIDLSHIVATGLVIRAAMLWVESDTTSGLIMVVIAFLATQLVMLIVSLYRRVAYRQRNAGKELEEAIKGKNLALAIRYAGHIIGAALALSSASHIVVFSNTAFSQSTLIWISTGLALVVIMSVLALIARMIILKNIDVVEEVDQQQNVGIASIEAAIYIAMGLIFMGGIF